MWKHFFQLSLLALMDILNFSLKVGGRGVVTVVFCSRQGMVSEWIKKILTLYNNNWKISPICYPSDYSFFFSLFQIHQDGTSEIICDNFYFIPLVSMFIFSLYIFFCCCCCCYFNMKKLKIKRRKRQLVQMLWSNLYFFLCCCSNIANGRYWKKKRKNRKICNSIQ